MRRSLQRGRGSGQTRGRRGVHPQSVVAVGRRYVQTAQGSKRKTVYAKTEADCWAKMEEARQTSADEIWEAENPYLADWLDTWLDGIRKRVRITTFQRYEQLARVHIKPALGHIRVKDLRHTAASLLLRLGIHPKQVQEMLGHKNIRLTLNTYSHFSPDMQDTVVSAMNLALNRSQKPQSSRP